MKKHDYNKKHLFKTRGSRDTSPSFNLLAYYPVFILLGIISLISLLVSSSGSQFEMKTFMDSFIGGFFVSFAFFKLINLRGFASAYAQYDLLASRFTFYGKLYPLIELALGLAYVSGRVQSDLLNSFTAILMLFSLIGVSNAVAKRKNLSCACLGNVINVPLSVVSIFENLLMILMAISNLFLGI